MDYFDDKPMGGEESSPSPDKDGMEQSDAETFLINKEAYPEAKPGDTFKVRVEEVYDKEMSCSVEHEEEKQPDGEPGGGEPEPEMAGNPMMD